MAMTMPKLLVAVDGSERSLSTVQYLTRVPPLRPMQVVVFHVYSGVPPYYWDLEREPRSATAIAQVRAWEVEQKREIQEYLQRCRRILHEGGFAAEAIETRIHPRHRGVARDIIAEAQSGYTAVVLRRRGTTRLSGLVMGSVAQKLMDKLSFLPVLVAGQKPINDRYLIAVDGSPCSERALHFFGTTMGASDCRVDLVHVTRRDNGAEVARYADSLTTVARGDNLTVAGLFDQCIDILAAYGLPRGSIATRLVTRAHSRAGGILAVAEENDCATIVVGRRGLSRVKDYVIGRVSGKVVQVGRKHTVWVVT